MYLNIDEKMFLFSFVNKHKVERKEEKKWKSEKRGVLSWDKVLDLTFIGELNWIQL